MPLIPCDTADVIFACDMSDTPCEDTSIFHVPGGNAIILRGRQVAPLEADGSSVAMLIDARTTLRPKNGSLNDTSVVKQTVTVTKHTTATTTLISNSGTFTTADIAGAAMGSALPRLAALVAVALLFFHQRGQLKAARNAGAERDKAETDSHLYGQSYAASPTSPAPSYPLFTDEQLLRSAYRD